MTTDPNRRRVNIRPPTPDQPTIAPRWATFPYSETVHSVQCTGVAPSPHNIEVIKDFVADTLSARPWTACSLCPAWKATQGPGFAALRGHQCMTCDGFHVPDEHLPVLIMRGLEV